MYESTFPVQGQGSFPVDMLRYDHCFPADTASAMAIADPASVDRNDLRTVTLRRYSPTKTHATKFACTDGRWKSFGWNRIGEIDIRKL